MVIFFISVRFGNTHVRPYTRHQTAHVLSLVQAACTDMNSHQRVWGYMMDMSSLLCLTKDLTRKIIKNFKETLCIHSYSVKSMYDNALLKNKITMLNKILTLFWCCYCLCMRIHQRRHMNSLQDCWDSQKRMAAARQFLVWSKPLLAIGIHLYLKV